MIPKVVILLLLILIGTVQANIMDQIGQVFEDRPWLIVVLASLYTIALFTSILLLCNPFKYLVSLNPLVKKVDFEMELESFSSSSTWHLYD